LEFVPLLLTLRVLDQDGDEYIELVIEKTDIPPMSIIVHKENMQQACRNLTIFLFGGEDLGFVPTLGCNSEQNTENSKNLILHMLGHRSQSWFHLYKHNGFTNHSNFEKDVKFICKQLYEDVLGELRPECWPEWIVSDSVGLELISSHWSLKNGSDIQFKLRVKDFKGHLDVHFSNRNEPNSLYILIHPSEAWYDGIISVHQALRICKRAEQLSNCLIDSKQRTMSSIILVDQLKAEHRNIHLELRESSIPSIFHSVLFNCSSKSRILFIQFTFCHLVSSY
jgi:hypothetical protein